MADPASRPPLLSPPLLAAAKNVLGIAAAVLAVVGGLVTFAVAGKDLVEALGHLFGSRGPSAGATAVGAGDRAVVSVVKSVDAVLLGLVQFLLAAFLWQILDPRRSLLEHDNLERLEDAKQILCKVVLVIVAVRMLSVLVEPAALRWEDLVFPCGIVALALATNSLGKAGKGAAVRP